MKHILENYLTNNKPKLWLCVSFVFLSYFGQAQPTKHVVLKKTYTEIDFLPNIDGYFTGQIPFDKFSSVSGIETNVGYTIISFKVRFADQENEIQCYGNRLADETYAYIAASAIGQPVVFTEIKAVSKSGKLVHLEPLRLIPITNESN